MFTITPKSITTALLIVFVWIYGSQEFYNTIINFDTQWYWYVIALTYTVSLNELFIHICGGHLLYEFDTRRIGYKILIFLATVENGWGPFTKMCMMHKNHHVYSDQGDKDPSNWRRHWYNMGVLSPINYIYQANTVYPDAENFFKEQKLKYKEIFDDLWTWIIEEYSHIFTLLFWLIVYLICPIIFFKMLIMGRFIMSMYTLFTGIFGHTWIPGGYRNFDTPDTSYNNLLFHYICLCLFPTVLQNNHHGQRYTLEQGHKYKWFEFDISKYIVRLIKHITEKK
jgi:hypothetical protein